MKFRELRAEEVECRVGQISEKGLSLLLYKTSRTDAALLDETVGAESWECDYQSIDGVLYCTVRVWVDGRGWVSKQDCGTPSNMEADKGNASDAFKRACFKWGIGRELYTAPFIWVAANDCNIAKGQNGKFQCYDRFNVVKMAVKDGKISELVIKNEKLGKVVYTFGQKARRKSSGEQPASRDQLDHYNGLVLSIAQAKAKTPEEVEAALFGTKTMKKHGAVGPDKMTTKTCNDAIGVLTSWANSIIEGDAS